MGWGKISGVVGVLVGALVLAGCAAGPSLGDSGIVIGTALPVRALDPAANAGAGGDLVAEQIYPHLLTTKPGTDALVPDIASAAGFDASGAYAVTLKPGLTFANGDRLTASDVVFSFTRELAIRAAGGPGSLLAGIRSVVATGSRTVVFQLATPGDQQFPEILASPAGAIVDEQVFPAHALADDQDIVADRPFAGPYELRSDNPGDLLTFQSDPDYRGALGAPRNRTVTLKLYTDPANLASDLADGAIDLAYGGLGPTQLRGLRADPGVDVVSRPGGSLHELVFDLDAMPYGETRDNADPKRSLAVRTAVADLVDRSVIAGQVDAGTTAPLWGFTSDELPGAEPVLRSITGDRHGGPDASAAQRVLDAADVTTPVSLRIAVLPAVYGPHSVLEYEALKSQLELSGLFTVDLETLTPAQFAAQRARGEVPAYQGGWSPNGLDPATYRAPYRVGDAQLGSHYTNPIALGIFDAPATEPDPAKRAVDLNLVQEQLATDLPVLPLVEDEQLAATGGGVTGVRFDGSLTLRFGSLRAR